MASTRLIATKLASQLRLISQYILPATCTYCHAYTPVSQPTAILCEACVSALQPTQLRTYKTHASHTPAVTCFNYSGIIRALLHQLKFLGNQTVVPSIQTAIRSIRPDCTYAIPIPSHISRQKERGFDVLDCLFKSLYETAYTPCLIRHKKTPKLYDQTAIMRQKLLKNAFTVLPHYDYLKDKSVMLLDDIYTSGSTVESAITCLKDYGIAHITVFTLCQRTE